MSYVLQPNEFPVVQAVYGSLVNAEWFDKTTTNEKACAQLVLLHFKAGTTLEELEALCIDTAREIFSKRTSYGFS